MVQMNQLSHIKIWHMHYSKLIVLQHKCLLITCLLYIFHRYVKAYCYYL